MSDSTAFLSGAALAGIAAVVVLKGAATPVATPNSVAPPSVLPLPSPSPIIWDSPRSSSEDEQLNEVLNKQKLETEQLKNQLKLQQEQLKNQQIVIDNLTKQVQPNAVGTALQSNQEDLEPSNNSLTRGALWALGGVVLTICSGVVLVAIALLFARLQRPARNVEYVHTVDDPSSYPPYPRRRSQLPPPRLEMRRVEHIDEPHSVEGRR